MTREFDTYDEFLAAHHERYDKKKTPEQVAKEKKRFDDLLDSVKDLIPR